MTVSLRIVPLVIVPLLAACGAGSPVPDREAPPVPPSTPAAAPVPAPTGDTVGPAVRAALGGDLEARYFEAAVDLNGDGQKEIVVYAAGPMVCGTGGCPVYVFTPSAEGLPRVGSISAAQPPVRLSPRSAQGWRNLIVGVAGGGVPSGNAELEFDGKDYASNPTVPPAKPVADLDGTEVLIPGFGSYTEGKAVPPPVLGDAGQPVAGSVLGTEIRARDAEDLRFHVLRKLTDRYAAEKGIAVTQAEIDAYVKHMREAMTNDPNLRSAGEEPAEDRAAREEIAGAFIRQWRLNKALYEQYGGRIIFRQGGPEPLDAYRKFLEDSQARGDFTIETAPLETELWRYYRDDSIHSFYPPGSAEEKKVFAAPPWAS